MTYTVAEKKQTSIDSHFGGGTRYTLTLTSKYVNNPDRDDHFVSSVVVDQDTFDTVQIGMKVDIVFALLGFGGSPVLDSRE